MSDGVLLTDFPDQLRVQGINFKGFGFLPKYVMYDTDLTLEAKTIYAYFCTYSGAGDRAFPSRDKILNDLQIAKDRYYSHFNLITSSGYISVEREATGNLWGRNLYTITSNPKKFDNEPEEVKDPKKSQAYQRIRISGIKSLGYGIIPKAVMLDDRLPIKAKGIYAYFCAHTGSGQAAFPKKNNILFHLQISEPTYYKFYKMLTELNYITVMQRHVNGKLSINDYYINDTPNLEYAAKKTVIVSFYEDLKNQDIETQNQDLKNQDIENQDIENQDIENQDTENQDLKNQDIENQDIKINKGKITNSKIINVYNPSINQHREAELPYPAKPGKIDGLSKEEIENMVLKEMEQTKTIPYWYINNYQRMEAAIHICTEYDKQIEWFSTRDPLERSQIDLRHSIFLLFNEALIEMLTTKEPMKLKGATVNYSKVYDKLIRYLKYEKSVLSGEYFHISVLSDTAISDYEKACSEKEIKNHLQYMKACIWNAMQTGEIGVQSQIRHDYGY